MTTSKKAEFPHLVLSTIAMTLLCLAAWKYSQISKAQGGTDAPADGPDLLAVFSENPDMDSARKDAAIFSDLCGEVVTIVQLDRSLPESERKIKTGKQFDAMRRHLRWYSFNKTSLQSVYPKLGPVMGKFLDAKAGNNSGELSSNEFDAWISAYTTLQKSAAYARDRL